MLESEHSRKFFLASFSRNQVNQVNHQKRTYYIPGKYLEQGNSLKANTVWKIWPWEIKSTLKNNTQLKRFCSLFSRESKKLSQSLETTNTFKKGALWRYIVFFIKSTKSTADESGSSWFFFGKIWYFSSFSQFYDCQPSQLPLKDHSVFFFIKKLEFLHSNT